MRVILLTKISGKQILINENMIEIAQETPDTVITMNNGHTYIVSEGLDEIIDKVIQFNRNSKRRMRSKNRNENHVENHNKNQSE
ncbi:MAG: flagellar FlbD family protein [Oscillospiraceae bacterium]|nr:flagellar FlbD family protein [Oscillospiraceae bacterium]